MKHYIKEILARLRGEVTTEELIRRGLTVGKNFNRLNQVIIDDSHAWLISIGDDVTLAPRVHILAHDASTKPFLNYTKIGRVTIGNCVFIGAGTVVLPCVNIGNNVIIGANSTITHDIPDGVVVAGCPARTIMTTKEYISKEKKLMESLPCYGEEYTMRGNITQIMKTRQKEEIEQKHGGYVI